MRLKRHNLLEFSANSCVWSFGVVKKSLSSLASIPLVSDTTQALTKRISKNPVTYIALVAVILLASFVSNSKAAYSFQANYDSGSLDANFSLGSGSASTDTQLPSLTTGYNSTNSLSYSYDGTSTLKYPTASNLPADKGSIEMKFQKDAYGDATNQDVGGMNKPQGIAYDAATGYIYTADRVNHRIIKTKIDGTGWATFGHYGAGPGQFSYPADIFFDPLTEYLYIADTCNARVVKTKFDGTGWQTLGGFNTTYCDSGNITYHTGYYKLFYDHASDYIFYVNNQVTTKAKIDGTGRTNLTFGGHGPAVRGGIYYDSASQFFYYADMSHLYKSKEDGTGWTNLGVTGLVASGGIFYDASSGYVYLIDTAKSNLIKIKDDGTGQTTRAGFYTPSNVFYDSTTSNFYISNTGSHNIIKTQFDGTGWTTFGSYYKNFMKTSNPMGSVYDSQTGYMYFSDTNNNRIIRTKTDGSGWQAYGSLGSGSGQFNSPRGMYFDKDSGYLYIADYNNKRIVKTKMDGTGWVALGLSNNPTDVYYDSVSTRLYISQSSNSVVISKIDGSDMYRPSWSTSYYGANGVVYDSASGYIYFSNGWTVTRTKIDGTGYDIIDNPTSGNINIDLGSSHSINRATLQSHLADSNYYRVQYSVDNLNWTTLWSIPKSATSGLRNQDSGTLTPVTARYIRVELIQSIYNAWQGSISELKVFNTDGTNVAQGIVPTADFAPSFGSLSSVTDGSLAPEGTSWNDPVYAVQLLRIGGALFSASYGISYNPVTGYLYIADGGRMVRTNWDATNWTSFGSTGTGTNQFSSSSKAFFDPQSEYIYVADSGNNRIVRTKIDGTGWQTTNDFNAKEKVLYSAQSTDDSRLVYDVASRKLRFYLAYSNKAQFVETPTLTLTDGSWYTVKASFNKAAHTLSIDLNGVNQVTQTYDTDWGSLSYGTSFYIGARNGSTTDRWDGMIDDININIESVDTTAPTNPTTLNTHFYYDNTKAVSFTSDNWGNSGTPYITWSGATDADSGLKGYYVYLGTDNTAEPNSTSGLLAPNDGSKLFQTHQGVDGAEQNVSVPANSLVTGTTYYLRMRTQDNDLNTTDPQTLFTYKYDGGTPDPPEYINISPVGCSTQSTFTFSWDAKSDAISGIAGYEYKKGSTGNITDAGNVTTLELSPYQEGDNVLYVRTKDNAGNASSWQTGVFCSTGLAHIIDGPEVTPGPASINVNWTSNKQTTSYVEVYEGNIYISEQGHTDYDISHSVKVVGLEPEKSYRYRLRWLDESGNSGESEWFNTTTTAAPSIKNFNANVISTSSAILTWSTNENSASTLAYGVSDFDTSIDMGSESTTFSKELTGLSGSTTYQVKLTAQTASDGFKYYYTASFSTPPLPAISGLSFDSKSPSTADVTWQTNVDTTSSVYYGVKGQPMKEISSSEKLKSHKVELTGLNDSTTYDLYVQGTDQYNNTAKSDTNSFTTPVDTTPPSILDVEVETSNVGLNRQDKSQIVVSWKTNKLSKGFVEYASGFSGDNYSFKANSSNDLSDTHLVIISDLEPNMPYHFRISATDKNGNIGYSDDQPVIPGEVQKSILNTLLGSLQNVFGWLGELMLK